MGGNVKATAIVKDKEILRIRLLRFGEATRPQKSAWSTLMMPQACSLSCAPLDNGVSVILKFQKLLLVICMK
jgi:hypothetical protein